MTEKDCYMKMYGELIFFVPHYDMLWLGKYLDISRLIELREVSKMVSIVTHTLFINREEIIARGLL